MTTAMESCKMAELRYEAPLATFDMDEWNEFLDGDGDGESEDGTGGFGDDLQLHPEVTVPCGAALLGGGGGGGKGGAGGGGVGCATAVARDSNFDDDETFSGSLEDLVNTFDDKIIKCFRNYGEQAEVIAPVQVRSENDESSHDTQTWWTLTGNYGGILPINWSQMYTTKTTTTDNDDETTHNDNDNNNMESGGSSDDEDAGDDEADMDEEYDDNRRRHEDKRYIAPDEDEDEEPVVTADEVISEIEGMLDGLSPDKTSSGPRNGLLHRRPMDHKLNKIEDKSELKGMCVVGLRSLRDDLNGNIRDLSEILIEELAVRDELDYEKELKNQFIWLLLTVQKRRREVVLEMSYRQKTTVPGNGYLTTVIPYQASQDPLAIEKLQIYIKILSAINEDHCSVPALLTDYILRVLCPTT